MNELKLALFQTDILWEDISGNLDRLYPLIASLKGKCDLIVLPELFTSGFTMQTNKYGESIDGKTIRTLQKWSIENDLAICSSFICCEENKYFNRGFFITPVQRFFYDKHHLFRMGSEPNHFESGNKPLIVSYKGWNISLQICYDLRFPVWCRNTELNSFDLQLFVANWPAIRQDAWDILLRARAIENQSYIAGVNRIGIDGHGLEYSGGSAIIDMKGTILKNCQNNQEEIIIQTLKMDDLMRYRNKFPVWKDADEFQIIHS
ncbi:MAG: amidohydrolase [Bacteroidales bacterium]